VQTDANSKVFEISRGTKQGDPLSSLLFNALLEHIFRPLKQKWAKQARGIELSLNTGHSLTNLRFADDVLIMARSKLQLRSMIADLQTEASKHGLELHPEKTKVITNRETRAGDTLQVNNSAIEILRGDDCIKYLGRKLSMNRLHEDELTNRIRAAWATFTQHRQVLTNKSYPLKDRLRLFNATVSATVLYGCEAWTLRIDQQKRLRTTQRKIMRTILGSKRRVLEASGSGSSTSGGTVDSLSSTELLEPWADFIRRTTHHVEDIMEATKIEDWLSSWRRRQWRFAGNVLRSQQHKWSHAAMLWNPLLHNEKGAHRNCGRPCKRWDEDFSTYCKTQTEFISWTELAADKELWRMHETAYVAWAK